MLYKVYNPKQRILAFKSIGLQSHPKHGLNLYVLMHT